MEMTDWQLVRKFAEDHSQTAFSELTQRYTNLVYRVCLRELSDHGLAEDAAQAVFLLLARKAPSLRPNRHEATLSPWLFQTALLTARNVRRSEQRRSAREQEATQIQAEFSDAPEGWADIEPLLNDALHALPPGQRTLILARYFEDRPLAEIGVGLGVSEDAARMRVNRALDRLRRFFAARSVALSAAALAALLPHAVHSAPAHAAALLARLPLPTSGGPSAPTHAQTIAQGAIHTMNLNRLRLPLGAAALVAVFVLGTAGAVRVTSQRKAQAVRAEQQQSSVHALAIMDQMYATYAAMKSFKCSVTSREEPLGTAQDAEYEIERPNKICFRRATLLGVELSGKAQAVSDGKDLYVTCTESSGANGSGLADRYAKVPLVWRPATQTPDWGAYFTDFGGLASWGTKPTAGMPAAALGGDRSNNMALTGTDYALGQPVTMSPPMINEHNVPDSVADVVIVTKHIRQGATVREGVIDLKTGKDVPSTITYYIGQRDHLLYKLTASYSVGSTWTDTRTETYADQDINPNLPVSDFVFTPSPSSHEVRDTSELFPGGRG